MGMLTSWLTAVGKQNPSSRSLLEALTGEEGDDLDQLKRMLATAKLSKLLSESKLLETPTWTNIPPRAEYDPASEGLFPGQRQIEAGGRFYRVPAGRPREKMVGPTFGEAGALSEIYKNLPLKELISSKAGPGMFQPFLQRFMGPEAAETMTGGTMFPTEETRTFEQYLPKFLELMEITKRPREGTRTERAPELKEEEPEAAPSEVHKIVPIAKMLMDEMRRIYGTLEEEKVPEIKTFKYGEGLRRGEEVLREPTKAGEKPRTGILGEFDEYKKVPGNENKTWMDFYSWRSATSKAQAKTMNLEEASKEYRQWLSLRKSIDDPTMVEAMLRAFGRDIPAGAPKDEQIEALKRMVDDEIDYWRSVVESKKEKPGGRPDALGLRREIEAIRSGR